MAEKFPQKDEFSSGDKTGTSGSSAFNLKECSDALKETFNQDYVNRTSQNESQSHSNDASDEDSDELTKTLEYDEEHLKELHTNMTDEQLQELKEKSSALKNEGNAEYKASHFDEALNLYTQALNSCPLQFSNERSILYANRSAVYIGLDKKKNALQDCDKALELNPNYLRALLRRAQLHRKMDNLEQSLEDYKKVLEIDPGIGEARQQCTILPGEIHEKNEKLKAEMLGKLKDLGNLVLRPFGLSTNNFKMTQDPNTGGYSINFQNNPN